MKELEKISQDLFDKIRSRFDGISLGDELAKGTTDPEAAKFFNFDFVLNDINYGNITVSIADAGNLKVYYGRNITDNVPPAERVQWYDFLKSLRFFAKRNMMMFDTRDISRSGLTLRDLKSASNSDGAYDSTVAMRESTMYGTRSVSFQEMGPVKIMVRHSSPVDEGKRGARTRHIETVFVETVEGERLKLPFTSLSGARAMGRHLQSGGTIQDRIGQHICDTVREMSDLRVFVRNTRGRVFEDTDTLEMANCAAEYYGELHERLARLKGNRSYNTYVGEYSPQEDATVDFDETELKDRFTRKLFDERMSSALSLVNKAYMRKKQAIPETRMSQEFESWANEVVHSELSEEASGVDLIALDKLFAEELPLGIDGSNAIAAISVILDDDDLVSELAASADEDTEQDARGIIYQWVIDNRPDIAAEMADNSPAQDDIEDPVGEEVDRYDQQLDLIKDVSDDEDSELMELRRLSGV
jgi:hypothetical protein